MAATIIPVALFDAVVFGATGDLTLRKLLPALYWRFRDGQMPPGARVIGAARSELDDAAFRERAAGALAAHVPQEAREAATVDRFLASLFYVRLDAVRADGGWERLAAVLDPERVRVFYLATAPDLYGPICRNIAAAGLASPASRVVLEKPIGHDLASARVINDEVGAVFAETQIFRIDHYLGKETVQNLLALRFANAIFARLWNADVIEHVQITVAETVGLEGRGAYYDSAGALRDMVQNHMLQLLCLIAMEPPGSLEADPVRDEKLKVLRALAPMTPERVASHTVRGQYDSGAIDGARVPGYLADLGDGRRSTTETFVALKVEIRNWRWAGVPFYLRTGKRLGERVSEIVVCFRSVPYSIFGREAGELAPNKLVLRLQPDEGVKLWLMNKVPGPGGIRLRRVPLDMSFAAAFGNRQPDAYERLLMDVVRGNAMLFMRRDEVEAAWRWVDPIIAAWAQNDEAPKPYTAGSWGPSAAVALIERDGRTWHEDAF